MSQTSNMGLTTWDLDSDPYDNLQLANNFRALDAHNHTLGKGVQIPTAGFQDKAVTEIKHGDQSVSTRVLQNAVVTLIKLAPDSVDASKIIDGAVGTAELAPEAVTDSKIDRNFLPVGSVITWYRVPGATEVPGGHWEIMDGRAWSSIVNTVGPGGTQRNTGNIPDMRNKFALGADVNNTGTGPASVPDIGGSGGSQTVNLSHTHTVTAHSHAVAGHTHTISSDGSHVHGITVAAGGAHNHSAGTDNQGSHAHTAVTSSDGSHSHSLSIAGAGDHGHTYTTDAAGAHNHGMASRPNAFLSGIEVRDTSTNARQNTLQTAYVPGFNGGAPDGAQIPLDPGHAHTGVTNVTPAHTHSSTMGSAGDHSHTVSMNTTGGHTHTVTVAAVADHTHTATADSQGAHTHGGNTGQSSSTTDAIALTTDSNLGTVDNRPAHVGLLYIMRVR